MASSSWMMQVLDGKYIILLLCIVTDKSQSIEELDCPQLKFKLVNRDDHINGKGEPNIESWQDCALLCRAHPDCLYWIWTKPSGSRAYRNKCGMATTFERKGFLAHAISGTKDCSGCDHCFYGECENPDAEGNCELFDTGSTGTLSAYHCVLPDDQCPDGRTCWQEGGRNLYSQEWTEGTCPIDDVSTAASVETTAAGRSLEDVLDGCYTTDRIPDHNGIARCSEEDILYRFTLQQCS